MILNQPFPHPWPLPEQGRMSDADNGLLPEICLRSKQAFIDHAVDKVFGASPQSLVQIWRGNQISVERPPAGRSLFKIDRGKSAHDKIERLTGIATQFCKDIFGVMGQSTVEST